MRNTLNPLDTRSWKALAATALASALLGACGGGGSGTTPLQPAGNENNVSALAASKPGELLAQIKATLLARQAQGINSALGASTEDGLAVPGAVATTASGTPIAQSNTTVQEAGVDEDDLLKSDGELIYALDNTGVRTYIAGGPLFGATPPARLQVHRRAADGKLQLLQTLTLPADASSSPSTRGMLLAAAAKRLAVLSTSVTPIGSPSPCPPKAQCVTGDALIYWPTALKSEVNVQVVELAGAGTGSATLGAQTSISGNLVGSRLIGSTLYLVTSYSPALAVDQLPAGTSATERDAQLAKLNAADILPTIRVAGGAAQPLLADTDCYVQPKNASLALQITTVTAIDLASPTLARASRCFAGGTEALYMAPANLYLATTRYTALTRNALVTYVPHTTTDIHKFAMSGLRIDYRGSGEVTGHLGWNSDRKPYRLSEHNGDLRVLSFTGEQGWAMPEDATATGATAIAPSPATLSILRERASDSSLQLLSTLPNAKHPAALGHAGEQVYAVRFVGDRGYLVTFRQTDPLYVLNLADPANPQQVGELAMPGFSDYLFPMDNGLLFGVGRDADASGRVGGVKVALMDVLDPTQPKLLTTQTFGSRSTTTTLDWSSHGINLFQRGDVVRVAMPMALSASDAADSWQQGLQRLEVNTQARTLVVKKMIPSTSTSPFPDISLDRSLQIESQVVYLSQGKLTGWDW